mmetsp:Transcript_8382/g.7758  ORF Transcript_8382/g.7758 Transcript_8382/m.7758 type:complete len:120 (+) Transcript_8382:505-864(+)
MDHCMFVLEVNIGNIKLIGAYEIIFEQALIEDSQGHLGSFNVAFRHVQLLEEQMLSKPDHCSGTNIALACSVLLLVTAGDLYHRAQRFCARTFELLPTDDVHMDHVVSFLHFSYFRSSI